jgi:hypothetical protein
MSNLIEIQEAIEKLAPKERAELWDWFQAQEVEETDEMLAAVDEGIRFYRRTRRNSCGRGSEADSEMDYKVIYSPTRSAIWQRLFVSSLKMIRKLH